MITSMEPQPADLGSCWSAVTRWQRLPCMLYRRLFHVLLVQVRSYHTYVVREILHHASLRHPFVVSLNQVILTRHVSRAARPAAAQLCLAGA